MTDKDFHFIAGAAVYVVAAFVVPRPFAVVVLVAAAKEAFDGISGRGNVEVSDFAATCLGGLVVAGIA